MEFYVHNRKIANLKHVKSKSEVYFGNSYVPDWFLVEVLSRLPVKTVFKFKCVSKQWLSLISAPSFTHMYISRASLSHYVQPWTVLSHTLHVDGAEFSASSFMFSDELMSPSFCKLQFSRSLSPKGEKYRIIAVSDGLILYGRRVDMENCHNHVTDYRIYSPMTGQCAALPPPCVFFTFASTGFLTQIEGGIMKSFKVVRFGCQLGESYILKFEIFSSETGIWRSVVVHSDRAIEVAWRRMPVAFNGNLHWIDRRLGFVSFNPCNDMNQCRIIGFPAGIDKQCNDARNNGIPSLCDVHKGRLRYVEVSVVPIYPYGFSGFAIWVLDDYDSASWTLQHRAKVSDMLFDDVLYSRGLTRSLPTPIAFDPLDSNIVYLGLSDTVVSYNIKTLRLDVYGNQVDYQEMDQRTGRRIAAGTPCWWSAFLFMLPSWPVSIPVLATGVSE